MRSAQGITAALLLGISTTACAMQASVYSTPSPETPATIRAVAPTANDVPRVLTSYRDSTSVGVHEVTPDPTGWRSTYLTLDEVPSDVAAISSPDVEALVSVHEGSGTVRYAVQDGDRWSHSVLATLAAAPMRLQLGDIDADGDDDIVVVSDTARPALAILHGSNAGFGPARFVPLDPKGRTSPTLALHDLDADGTLDVLATVSSGGASSPFPDHVRVFRNATHGLLVDESMVRVPAPLRLRAGDVDEDGLLDVLVLGARGAWLLASAGHGWLHAPRRLHRGSAVDGALVDHDGDGHLDVVILDAEHDRLVVRDGSGAGRLAPPRTIAVGAQPIGLAIARDRSGPVLVTANVGDQSFTTVTWRPTTGRSSSRRSGT